MPAIRRYRVTETRELLVTATDPADAVRVAGEKLKAHDNAQLTAEDINMRSVDISAMED